MPFDIATFVSNRLYAFGPRISVYARIPRNAISARPRSPTKMRLLLALAELAISFTVLAVAHEKDTVDPQTTQEDPRDW
jgi:hypothetical protein